ncbi:MAG: hypothetical protein SGPRY_000182 [Prymnesium sp.]
MKGLVSASAKHTSSEFAPADGASLCWRARSLGFHSNGMSGSELHLSLHLHSTELNINRRNGELGLLDTFSVLCSAEPSARLLEAQIDPSKASGVPPIIATLQPLVLSLTPA